MDDEQENCGCKIGRITTRYELEDVGKQLAKNWQS